MKYVVLLNGSYMNSFNNYTEAVELRERLKRNFPNANIEIVGSDKE